MAETYHIKELREQNIDQLAKILAEKREKFRHLRFQVFSREVKNHRELRFLRREIAKIMTVISEKTPKSAKKK